MWPSQLSVINKIQTIQLEIGNKEIALCALTETWIKEDDDLSPLCMCHNGYKSLSIPRSGKTGRGLALVHKESINVTSRKCRSYNMMECVNFIISLPNKFIQLGLLYWPPERSILQLYKDLATCMEANINEPGECVLLGDLNIHVNKKDDQDTITLLNTLKSFGLQNRFEFPTCWLLNTLDLTITEQKSNIVKETGRLSLISDHNLIHFILQTPSKITTMKQVSYGKTKAMNTSLLKVKFLWKHHTMEIAIHLMTLWNYIICL